jgi:hypothetical protein
LRKRHPRLIVDTDLAGLFLSLASATTWTCGSARATRARRESTAQKDIVERGSPTNGTYGRSSAFRGWYLSRPIDAFDDASMRQCEGVAAHLQHRGIAGAHFAAQPWRAERRIEQRCPDHGASTSVNGPPESRT